MSDDLQSLFDPKQVLEAYHEQRYAEVSEALLAVLRHFKAVSYPCLDADSQRLLDVFVKHFLYLFTQEDYVPADAHLEQFIALNPVIANVVAMSSFRTTDVHVTLLKQQKHNFAKMLALYSARNTVPLNRLTLFDCGSELATQWYYRFWGTYRSACAGENSLRQLQEHLRFRDQRQGAISNSVAHAYLGCTYVDCENDRDLKRHINATFRQWGPAQMPIANRPDFRRIAVLTGMWFPRHSVYRCMHSFVTALAAEFDLTLVHLGPQRSDLDTTLFKAVRQFEISDRKDLAALSPNDWGIAYYPDVGMNVESIFLSNLRLAPIQISCYGHPVSTWGSRIDYWLGGRDVEPLQDCERNYSERLVLVPGCGVTANRPDYDLRGLQPAGEVLTVDCPWSGQKINFPLLQRLRRILDRSQRRIRLRFFTGTLEPNGFLPLRRDLTNLLGPDNAEVFAALPHQAYMRHIEQGDFQLDSYPFGGYATATDALYLGKPIITWEGTRFYNRSTASLLRRVGLQELIARDGDAYEALALRLIHEDAYRSSLAAKLAAIDLERTIFVRDEAKYVVEAFHYLVKNHEKLQAEGLRKPIVIGS